MFCDLKNTYVLKSRAGVWKRVSCNERRNFIAVGVFPEEQLPYQVSMVCAVN